MFIMQWSLRLSPRQSPWQSHYYNDNMTNSIIISTTFPARKEHHYEDIEMDGRHTKSGRRKGSKLPTSPTGSVRSSKSNISQVNGVLNISKFPGNGIYKRSLLIIHDFHAFYSIQDQIMCHCRIIPKNWKFHEIFYCLGTFLWKLP